MQNRTEDRTRDLATIGECLTTELFRPLNIVVNTLRPLPVNPEWPMDVTA